MFLGCPKLSEPAPAAKLPTETQQSIRPGDCLGTGTKSFAHITSMSHLHPLPPVREQPSCKIGPMEGRQGVALNPAWAPHCAQASVVCMEQDVSSMARTFLYPDVLCYMGSR